MAEEQLSLLDLEGSEQILDVGCGDGRITAKIAGRVPRGSVLGVDPSRDMIAFATAQSGPSDRTNLRFAVADARRLPYRNEFDLVVSFNALHWVPEQDEALRSIRATLRPAGRAMLRLVPAGERKSLEDVIEEVRASAGWADFFGGCRRPYFHPTAEEYRSLADRNGLRVDGIRIQDKAWGFGSRDAYLAFCRATLVEWTSRLPEERRDSFIVEVLDRYRAAAARGPDEADTFKFYQMDVALSCRMNQGLTP
jgi:trans-aconitate methyltransferase